MDAHEGDGGHLGAYGVEGVTPSTVLRINYVVEAVIDDDGALRGCLYQLFQCHTGGEEVTIEEYHLCRRGVGVDEEIEFTRHHAISFLANRSEFSNS